MIIKHVTDAVTDTDKLSDVDSMILEKSEELRKLCYDTARPCVILVSTSEVKEGKLYQFFNFRRDASSIEAQTSTETESGLKDFNRVLYMVNKFVTSITQDNCAVMNVPSITEEVNKAVGSLVEKIKAYETALETIRGGNENADQIAYHVLEAHKE